MFPSLSLYFDIDKIKGDISNSIKPEPGRRVWLKSKNSHIDALDKYMREKFQIPAESRMVFSLYLPPSGKDKTLFIKKSQHKLVSRVLVSTIAESPEIVIGRKTEKMKMKQNEAYNIPYPASAMMTIEFDNSRTLIIPARKGFRQLKMTKKVENRYIMMMDYVYVDTIKEAINELTNKDEELRGYDNTDNDDQKS